MVIAPHPDDETIIAAGIMQAAVQRGDTVKVVVVTNGDLTADGLVRQAETVAAMTYLGVPAANVMFLGYGDQSLVTLYETAYPNTVYTSPAGQTQTYGNQGLGSTDYHNYRYGTHASYTRANVVGDIEAAIAAYMPADIYTTSVYDGHVDHLGTGLFVTEAILNVRKHTAPTYSPKVHDAIVHWGGGLARLL